MRWNLGGKWKLLHHDLTQKDFPSQDILFCQGATSITKDTVVTDHVSDGLLVFLHHNSKEREVRSVIKDEMDNRLVGL